MVTQHWDGFLLQFCTESKLLKGTNAGFNDRLLCADLDDEYFVKIFIMPNNNKVQVGVYRDGSWYNSKFVREIPSLDELDAIIGELIEGLKIDEYLFLYEHH
jgi:hypothetical protein